MKKAKLMLTSIAILAVVGGALAFKAKSAYTSKFCTSTTSGTCPGAFAAGQAGGTGTQYYYVVTNNANNCASAAPNCSGDKVNNITTSTTFLSVD
jgi:hypothetical protein